MLKRTKLRHLMLQIRELARQVDLTIANSEFNPEMERAMNSDLRGWETELVSLRQEQQALVENPSPSLYH